MEDLVGPMGGKVQCLQQPSEFHKYPWSFGKDDFVSELMWLDV